MSIITKTLRDKRGLSLVELVTALAIFGTVLAIGYNALFSTYKAFDRAEQHSLVRRDMRLAVEYITKEVRVAYNLGISSAPPPADYFSDPNNELSYIYFDNSSKAILHLFKDSDGNAHERSVLDGSLDGFDYSLNFYSGLDSNGNNIPSAVLHFLITENNLGVNMGTNVIANNVPALTGDASGFVLSYEATHESHSAGSYVPPGGTPAPPSFLRRLIRFLLRPLINI